MCLDEVGLCSNEALQCIYCIVYITYSTSVIFLSDIYIYICVCACVCLFRLINDFFYITPAIEVSIDASRSIGKLVKLGYIYIYIYIYMNVIIVPRYIYIYRYKYTCTRYY